MVVDETARKFLQKHSSLVKLWHPVDNNNNHILSKNFKGLLEKSAIKKSEVCLQIKITPLINYFLTRTFCNNHVNSIVQWLFLRHTKLISTRKYRGVLSDYTHIFGNQTVKFPHPLSAWVLDRRLRLLPLYNAMNKKETYFCNTSFSHNATAAKLVYQNNELMFLISWLLISLLT